MDATISILPLPNVSLSQPRKMSMVEVVVCCVALPRLPSSPAPGSSANKVICGTLSNQLFVVDLDGHAETTCIHLPHDGPLLDMKLFGRQDGDTLLFVDQGGLFCCINLVDETVEEIAPKDPVSLHLYAPSQPQSRPLVSIPLVPPKTLGRIADATLLSDGGFVLCCYHVINSDKQIRSNVVLQTAMGDHNMIVQEFPFEDKVLQLSALSVPAGMDSCEWSIVALVTTLHTVYTIKMSVSHLNTVLEALCVDLVETDELVSVVKLCNALDFDFDQVVLCAGLQALNDCGVGSDRYPSALASALKVWKQRKKPIPLNDLRDAFGYISQWPSGVEEVCRHSDVILNLLMVHWHDVVPGAAVAQEPNSTMMTTAKCKPNGSTAAGGWRKPFCAGDTHDDSALALWFITVIVLLLTCQAGSALLDWRLWIDCRVRKSVKNLNLLEPYAKRTPMSFGDFKYIIGKDFATFQNSLLPEETCFRHWLRQYLDIASDHLPTMTDLHTRLDVAWPDTILAVSTVAMVEDVPLPHSIDLLQCLRTRPAVLYASTFALFSRQHAAYDLSSIEDAVIMAGQSRETPGEETIMDTNAKRLANGTLLLDSFGDHSPSSFGQVGASMEWDLQAALFDDKWDGVCVMDLLDEAPKTGTWGFLCKTLLKTYPDLWQLCWSTRFRLFLCTFLEPAAKSIPALSVSSPS
eukprot:GEMP01011913.1.p1 GENE.GEMP01011913.1~~GEMP01011913.1.p1  ORF type:complete len:690 (+),score=143.01 GEMP01011913.1:625-2694(+)